MANPDKFFGQIFNEHLNNLHTTMPCEVIYVHEDKPLTDIQPLFQRKTSGEPREYPLIEKVPKLKHVEEINEGDIVFVAFAERALDFVGNRRHDLRDAVIIGVMEVIDDE